MDATLQAADKVFATVAGAAATLVDGSNGGRRLFVPDPDTGRGVVERGAFIGYIAVSTTKVLGGEVDVAIVWRGTIFKEEWESNFASDKLVSSSTIGARTQSMACNANVMFRHALLHSCHHSSGLQQC